MKKILWISPRWPEPPNDGARIATFELIKHLALEKDFSLTFLAIVPENESLKAIPGIDSNQIIILKRKISDCSPFFRMLRHPNFPITFDSFIDSNLTNEVNQVLAAGAWDAVIFDGIHAAVPFIKCGLPKNTAFFYRAHNAECKLWERMALVNSGIKRYALLYQSYLVKKFEMMLLKQSKCTFPVSHDDAAFFLGLVKEAKIKVVHIGQTFEIKTRPVTHTKSPITLGFIGRLDWLPNQQGLTWFLTHVWPEILQKKIPIQLIISGSGDSSWISPYLTLAQIKFLGRVPNIEDFYQGIDASIVPLFFGSGTRVKVIEASRLAIPCVSTAIGVEGCPLRSGHSYLNAESIEDWVSVLRSTTQTEFQMIGGFAFEAMKSNYDSENCSKELIAAIKQSIS